jgi:hypothetical protein
MRPKNLIFGSVVKGPRPSHTAFRSPALGRYSAGARLMPSYCVDEETMRHETWRLRRQARGKPAGTRGTREKEVAERWGWTRRAPGRYDTPLGELDLSRDGKATQQMVMEESWRARQWRIDKRGDDDASLQAAAEGRPMTATHEAWAKKDSDMRRVALGAALDCKAAKWLDKTYGVVEDKRCMCGQPLPSRRHWLNGCGSIYGYAPPPSEGAELPGCQIEDALAVRIAPRPPPVRERKTQRLPGLETMMREEAAASGNPLVVATDGGVCHPANKRMRIGAWGVAAQGSQRCIRKWSHPVLGLDQTSFAAELHGAVAVLRAAANTGTAVSLIIDNKSVQRGVASRLAGSRGEVPRYSFGIWQEVEELADRMVRGSMCSWTPAHGRHEEWEASRSIGASTAQCRALNDAADNAASSLAEDRWLQERQAEEAAQRGADAWGRRRLQRLRAAEAQWTLRWREKVAGGRLKFDVAQKSDKTY